MEDDKHISFKAAYIRASALCGRSEKCISEIRTKLYQWKLDVDKHDVLIEQLIEEKFIDESRFTSFFVRDKFRFNKWGKIKIAHHLSTKGINQTRIKEALASEIKGEDYYETLKSLLQTKLRSISYKDEWDKKQKLMRYAASRGFESYIVQDLID